MEIEKQSQEKYYQKSLEIWESLGEIDQLCQTQLGVK